MKNLLLLAKLVLVLPLFFATKSSAQTILYNDSTGVDLPNTNTGPVFNITTPGTYVVKGLLKLARDREDWFSVQIGTGVQISNIAYSITGGGIVGGIRFNTPFGPTATAPGSGNLDLSPYTALPTGTYSTQMYATTSTGTQWTVTFTITIAPEPFITTQPTDQAVCPGNPVTFSSVGGGNPAPTIQWQESADGGNNWTDIPGETSADLTFTPVISQNGFLYSAAYTNVLGTTYSDPALLSFNSVSVVSSDPSDETVPEGSNTNFNASANGSPAPDVQWQVSTDNGVSFSDVPGATSTTLSFPTSIGDDQSLYRAVFSNTCGNDTTTAARLTVTALVPVTLSSFELKKSGSAAVVQWTTEQELNCKGFEILRSRNGRNFETIAWVDGKGNSTQKNNYTYTDKTPNSGINFYRLKQVDQDGKEVLTDVKVLSFDLLNSLSISPNPAHSQVILSTTKIGMIRVTDLSGKQVMKVQNIQNILPLNVQSLAPGVYIIHLITPGGIESKKLFKK